VRASGLLDRPAGVERGDHVCWAYDDDAAFEDAAVRFLAEGLGRDDRLLWVGDGAAGRLRRAPGRPADVDGPTAQGALSVLSVAESYAAAGPLPPERQLAFYDVAARGAIDEGHRGLRVVAEITWLAADEGQPAQLLCWEHLADDYVAHGPGFSALCAYRRDLLPADAGADVASLHPLAHADGGTPAFRVWFDEDALLVAGDTVALWAGTPAGSDRRLVLRGASRPYRRMWDLLAPDGVPGASFAERRP
jgi:hypothetical protein